MTQSPFYECPDEKCGKCIGCVRRINRDPRRIHGADEKWTAALNHLGTVMEYIEGIEPMIYSAGGNTDASVLFDFMAGYIQKAEQAGGLQAQIMTRFMCAAAITKLVRASRTTSTDDTLAQLERDMHNDDH